MIFYLWYLDPIIKSDDDEEVCKLYLGGFYLGRVKKGSKFFVSFQNSETGHISHLQPVEPTGVASAGYDYSVDSLAAPVAEQQTIDSVCASDYEELSTDIRVSFN